MRGGRDREPPARLEHAPDLRQEELHVAHVLERLGADDQVERAVGERQRRVGLELDGLGVRQARPRALERDRATRRRASACRRARRSTRAPSPQPRSSALRAGSSDSTQARRSGGAVRRVGHELPQLVVVAAGHAGMMPPWRYAYSPSPRRPSSGGAELALLRLAPALAAEGVELELAVPADGGVARRPRASCGLPVHELPDRRRCGAAAGRAPCSPGRARARSSGVDARTSCG